MAQIPAFSDIGKASNDLINKDFYHVAAAALEVKLKAPNGVSFTTKGTSPQSGAVSGSIEGKKAIAKGITFTQSWTTASLLTSKLELENNIADGLKVEALTLANPAKSGFAGQKLNLIYKHPLAHFRVFGDLQSSGAINTVADAVFGHEGFIIGGEVGYNVQDATVNRYSTAIGYATPEYSAALTATQNLSVFTALYYQKVNAATEAGIKAVYDAKSQATVGLELAAKYKIDPLSFTKVKINDRGTASIAYNTKVNSGFTFGVGASFDTQKLNEAGHKVGASFTFEG